jgi:DNA-binding transcriptional regulator YdaS (Cro superfamily)
MNAIEQVIGLLGSQTAVAAQLEISPQAVNQWLLAGQVPVNRVLDIEVLVGEKVTRYQLRPDIYGDGTK